MSASWNCHYCGESIDENTLYTVVTDYPVAGCEQSHFCPACVNVNDEPAVRGKRIEQLFIALVTAEDLDAPRILPGSA